MTVLKKEREALGKTQKEVAEETGISYSMIQLLEQGRRSGSDQTKIKLANYYGTTVEYLFFSNNITQSNKKV
ncbi:helix-turn-helix domain-containing protein [Desemzia sp. FAM 23990]|uniref:helix-turn-helix domain-containing protein n=1 Tax=Desemzia sp. FAM 23990 TaxID=3259520 RepID=UPI003884A137